MTLRPLDMDKAFVKELRASGLDDLAIQEAANVGFHYNLINRVADALDFPVPQGINKQRLAKMLNITGKLLKGSAAEEVWVRGESGVIRPTEVEIGRAHMLAADGVTTPSLRRSVEAFVVGEWDINRGEVTPVPTELETFLKKLSLHAYKITDEDVQALQNTGYSDEMLYEITIVGSIGAALMGLEKLFEALYG